MNQAKIVNCSACDKSVPWVEESLFRPFCCERCKLIDFGEWAAEKNTIAGEPVFSDEEDASEKLQ